MSATFLHFLKALGLPVKGLVHVGANSGQEVPAYVAANIPTVILIEPLPQPFAACVARIKGQKSYVAVRALCTDVEGSEYDFHVASNEGQSSSILKPARHLAEHPEVQFKEDVMRLRSRTLDNLLHDVRKREVVDVDNLNVLCLDTQGSELVVLKGSGKTLGQIDAVWTEVSRGGLYDGDVSFEDLSGFLSAYGFMLNNVGFNRHHWGDALFIRRTRLGA